MTFEKWAENYFAKFPASQDTRLMYTAAKAAWHATDTETANEPSKGISGYRELSIEETELINQIKAQGEELQLLLLNLEASGLADPRWIDIARTNMQLGNMAAVRAVAKPNSF